MSDVPTGLSVNVVHLSRLYVAEPVLLVEQDGRQDQLLLAWERGDDGRHLIRFNLALGDSNVALIDDLLAKLLGLLRRDAKQVECTASVTVLLGSESGTQFNDAGSNGLCVKPFLSTLAQDVLQLLCVVRAEEHIELSETGANPRVEEIGKFEVV